MMNAIVHAVLINSNLDFEMNFFNSSFPDTSVRHGNIGINLGCAIFDQQICSQVIFKSKKYVQKHLICTSFLQYLGESDISWIRV